MKYTFELKSFTSSQAIGFTNALKLYNDNVEPEYRTESNEIIYWLDNFEKTYRNPFYILGLYLNKTLVGFCEMVYFKEEKIVIVDYIVIEKLYRRNSAFYQFTDLISKFIADTGLDFLYVICEVGCYFDNGEPTENSKTLIRLLKMNHFGVVKTPYYVPRLGIKNYESEMRAVLMIYSNNEIKQIKKETYLFIVDLVYYKYYQKWYDKFLNKEEKQEYKMILDALFNNIKNTVKNKESIEINGFHNLLPINPIDFAEIKNRKSIKIISFIALFFVFLFLFGVAGLIIQRKWGVDLSAQSLIITLALFFSLFITSIFFENKSNFISNIIDKLIDKI